ncbi:MAG: hypothetical protein AMXMBFR66_00640 [Pseudomonadota bacterium]
MQTSGMSARRPRPGAEPAAPSAARPVARTGGRAPRGFTLLEVLAALAIVALVAAVALPGLGRRLDIAFADADLEQVRASALLLPARTATLGIELTLDEAAVARALPDGQPPLDLPQGWSVQVRQPPRFGRGGSCAEGAFDLRAPADGRRWRFTYARLSCALSVVDAAEGGP